MFLKSLLHGGERLFEKISRSFACSLLPKAAPFPVFSKREFRILPKLREKESFMLQWDQLPPSFATPLHTPLVLRDGLEAEVTVLLSSRQAQ